MIKKAKYEYDTWKSALPKINIDADAELSNTYFYTRGNLD